MDSIPNIKEKFNEISPFLIALGDEKRQAIIIRLLEKDACEGLQVTDLIEVTQLSRPAISHHLKVLRSVQLVDFKRQGTKNFYSLTHETADIKKLKHMLEQIIFYMEEG